MQKRILISLILLGSAFLFLHSAIAEVNHPIQFRKPVIRAGLFLIASQYQMNDPRFAKSVILIVRHEKDQGTLGLILNRPTKLTVRQAFPGFTEAMHLSNPVYLGGPVSPRQYMMLVRTSEKFEGGDLVLNHVSFAVTEAAIEEWLGRETQKNRIRVFAGYSGWTEGQLEREINLGGWILEPADAKTVFDTDPDQLWEELTARSSRLQAKVSGDRLP